MSLDFSEALRVYECCRKCKDAVMNLSGRRLRDFPFDLSAVGDHLRELLLNDNRLRAPPLDLGALRCVEVLNLEDNELTSIPVSMFEAPSLIATLKSVLLSRNSLVVLTPAISHFKQLRQLAVSGCGLRDLPATVCDLMMLQYLDISCNKINTLPVEFGDLPSLQWLNAESNLLEDLPASFSRLGSLFALNLGRNRFILVPKQLLELKSLNNLDLSGNQIGGELSDEFLLAASGYKRVDMRGNPGVFSIAKGKHFPSDHTLRVMTHVLTGPLESS